MEEKGILTVAEQKQFGKIADSLIDFTKFKGEKRWVNIVLTLMEKKDDDIFTAAIKFLDDRYGDKLPVDLKPIASGVAKAVLNKDKDALAANSAALIDALVDIPKVSDEAEAVIIAAIVKGILDALQLKL